MTTNSADQAAVLCTTIREWEHKETLRCTFCGGKNCMRCGDNAYTLMYREPAFKEFHSSWITTNILAMQRPSDEIMERTNMVEEFVKANITCIFNLTEPGEHPYCGYGLKESGFPYTPEHFMKKGIKHFNYAWRDMEVPNFTLMLDIVQVATSELKAGGKIAVHCHAGFGRTGLCIASILSGAFLMTATDAIQLVRTKRPKSVQTKQQERFVRDFHKYYRMISSSFFDVNTDGTCSHARKLQLIAMSPIEPELLIAPFKNNSKAIINSRSTADATIATPTSAVEPIPTVSSGRSVNAENWKKAVPMSIQDSVKCEQYFLLPDEVSIYRYVPKHIVIACRSIKNVLVQEPRVRVGEAVDGDEKDVFAGFPVVYWMLLVLIENNRFEMVQIENATRNLQLTEKKRGGDQAVSPLPLSFLALPPKGKGVPHTDENDGKGILHTPIPQRHLASPVASDCERNDSPIASDSNPDPTPHPSLKVTADESPDTPVYEQKGELLVKIKGIAASVSNAISSVLPRGSIKDLMRAKNTSSVGIAGSPVTSARDNAGYTTPPPKMKNGNAFGSVATADNRPVHSLSPFSVISESSPGPAAAIIDENYPHYQAISAILDRNQGYREMLTSTGMLEGIHALKVDANRKVWCSEDKVILGLEIVPSKWHWMHDDEFFKKDCLITTSSERLKYTSTHKINSEISGGEKGSIYDCIICNMKDAEPIVTATCNPTNSVGNSSSGRMSPEVGIMMMVVLLDWLDSRSDGLFEPTCLELINEKLVAGCKSDVKPMSEAGAGAGVGFDSCPKCSLTNDINNALRTHMTRAKFEVFIELLNCLQALQAKWSPDGAQNTHVRHQSEPTETKGNCEHFGSDMHVSATNRLILLRICVSLIPIPTRGIGRFVFHKIVGELMKIDSEVEFELKTKAIVNPVEHTPVQNEGASIDDAESASDNITIKTVLSVLTSYATVSKEEVVCDMLRCGYGRYREQFHSEKGCDESLLIKAVCDIVLNIKTLYLMLLQLLESNWVNCMRYDGLLGTAFRSEHFCKTHTDGLFSNAVRWSSIGQLRKDRERANRTRNS